MATDNRGVMVYLPSDVEAKISEYCTDYDITRKDKQGNIVTSLGTGIIAYLKSQLLNDVPKSLSERSIAGLTKQEVLDLIAESNTNNTLINRSPNVINVAVIHRLEKIEKQLSSSPSISRGEVEQLIQVSAQRVMDAVRSMSIELWGEIAEVKTIEEQVNIPPISTISQEKSIEDTVKLPEPDTRSVDAIFDDKPLTKDIKRWLEPLKDQKFSDIIQAGISEELSTKEIVTRLFTAGYGKNDNTEPYPPNLASAMKTAFKIQDSGQKEFMMDES
jgi:hypothetical protein